MKKLAVSFGVLLLLGAAGIAAYVQRNEYDLTKVLGWTESSTPAEETLSAAQSPAESSEPQRADQGKEEAQKQPDSEVGANPDQRPPEGSDREPRLDVARINPDGVSVFAGRGKPYQTINILADGVVVGTTKVDENGEWVLVTERKIAGADPEVSLEIASGQASGSQDQVAYATDTSDTAPQGAGAPGASAPGDASPSRDTHSPGANASSVNAPGDASAPSGSAPRQSADLGNDNAANASTAAYLAGAHNDKPSSRVSDINSKLLDDLQRMVDSARRDGAGVRPAPATDDDAVKDEARSGKPEPENFNTPAQAAMAAQEAAKPAKPAPPPRAEPDNEKIVPIPIQFVYREATFTPNGEKAANLLLQYLKAGKHEQVTLSGHADERGTEALNMELSAQRLKTVEKYLRDGGFTGKLILIPKGESEPFTGVDRASFSKEELFQLDRRVELHLAD